MFNWRAACTCFSIVGLVSSLIFTFMYFDKGEEEAGAAFLVATMILVFVSGGLVFT